MTPRFTFLAPLLIGLFSCLFHLSGYGASADKADPGYIVWLTAGHTAKDMEEILQHLPIDQSMIIRDLGFNMVHLTAPAYVIPQLKETLMEAGILRFLGPNLQAEVRNTVPNDPDYSLQGFHAVIGSERAWDISTGGTTPDGIPIVSAVMDAGFEGAHEDIQDNLWINPGEIPNDGVDNDGNGFIDDFNGYNPRSDSGDVPVHYHGHAVSGYIGAKGNNAQGVTGINWDAHLMLVGPTIYASEFIAGFRFIYDWRKRFNDSGGQEGAYIAVLNMSLGFGDQTPTSLPWMCPLVDSLHDVGVLIVGAAPNAGIDIGIDGDMPCLCGTDNLICVTNTTLEDDLVSNAGYSSTYIHLSAPGYNSFTTRLTANGGYGNFSGTSAATPMVAGSVALLASMPCDDVNDVLTTDPTSAAGLLREAILSGTTPVDDLAGITVTEGRLCLMCDDGAGAVNALSQLCGSAEGELAILEIRPNPANTTARILFRTPGTTTFPLRVYNMLGQLVYEEEFAATAFETKEKELPVWMWSPGMYYVTAGSGKSASTYKLVVQH